MTEPNANASNINEGNSIEQKENWLDRFQQNYAPYSALIGWLALASVFLPMMAVYWESCSGRFLVLLSTIITLWVVELVPLWVTAMAIPVLVVWMRVMAEADGAGPAMNGGEASRVLFQGIFGSVPVTLLAVFSMSQALKLHGPLRYVPINWVVWFSTSKIKWGVLCLILMLKTVILSAGMSSIPAVEASLAIVQPVLNGLSSDSLQSQLLFGSLLIAGNLGAIASPVAGAHAIFAFDLAHREGYHLITWKLWLGCTLPILLITAAVCWIGLMTWFVLSSKSNANSQVDQPLTDIVSPPDSWKLAGVTVVYITTIIGWILSSYYQRHIGDMGIISMVPVIILFGSKLLNLIDLTMIPWQVILLAIGGAALSVAAEHSGYLQHIAARYLSGLPWIVFLLVPGVFSVYKSHFITALLFLPAVIASNRGLQLSESEAAVRFFITLLGSSLGMALPISGMTNIVLEERTDRKGEPRLKLVHFIAFGLPATAVFFGIAAAIGKPILESMLFRNKPG